ncbi:MAG: YesL family protein [Propionibacteriaceae bacterium]|jgi:uncharacterized membrane protein YesL|nr:YesL family protein [Propionibacteriaceae bacterium]
MAKQQITGGARSPKKKRRPSPYGYGRDNEFMIGLEKIGAVVWINLLWLASSLLVITIGLATAAAYDAGRRRGLSTSDSIAARWWSTIKTNWRTTGIFGLLAVLVAGAGLLTFWNLASQGPAAWALPVVLCAGAMTMLLFWCVPLATRFSNGWWRTLSNGFILSLSHLLSTLVLMIVLAATFLAVWLFFPLVFILPGLVIILWARWFERLMRKHGFLPTVPAPSAVVNP